jgi:hypothetical protein
MAAGKHKVRGNDERGRGTEIEIPGVRRHMWYLPSADYQARMDAKNRD